jgi:hypothetical protein
VTDKTPRPSKRPKSNAKTPSRPAPHTRSTEQRVQLPPPKPRTSELSRADPEIRIAIAPAGRETLDAIASELSSKKPARGRGRSHAASAPEIVVEQGPAGRETLAAINEELAGMTRDTLPSHGSFPGRDTLPTLPYGDRVPNAPGAITPSFSSRSATFGDPSPEPPSVGVTQAEIFEMRTFVVQKADAQSLEGEAERLQFVTQRLAHRLPGGSAAGVSRVDVTPWTERETLILRVWCRVE